MDITPQKIGLGLLLLLIVFGPIAIMFSIMLFIKQFSIKALQRFALLAAVVQFCITLWFYYIHYSPSDCQGCINNEGFGFLYFFYVIPAIVISYLFLIQLLKKNTQKVNYSVILLFTSIVVSYLLLLGIPFFPVYYILGDSVSNSNPFLVALMSLFVSVLLIFYPALKMLKLLRK